MGDYTTRYVFEIEVQGQEAIQRVREIRTELDKLAGGGAARGVGMAMPFGNIAQAVAQAEHFYFGLRRMSYGLQSAGRDMINWSNTVIRWAKQAADAWLDYEEALTRASMAMELPIAMQKKLQDATMETAAALGMFSAADILKGMKLWVMGTGEVVRNEEELQKVLGATAEIMKLATIHDVDYAQTVVHVGAVLAEFGLTTTDTNEIVELLNFTAAKTFATVDDLGQSFKMVGPIMAEAGDDAHTAAAAFGLLADQGIRGTMAGRALRQVYIQLLRPTEQVKEAMEGLVGYLAKAGEDWRDIVFPAEQFVGLAEYIDILAAATENYSDAEKEMALATIATANELPALIALVNQQQQAREYGVNIIRAIAKEEQGIIDGEVRAYARMMTVITGIPYKIKNATTLWGEYMGTWEESDIKRAKALEIRWNNAMTSLGESIFTVGVPAVEKLAEVFEDFAEYAEKHPEEIKLIAQLTGLNLVVGHAINQLGQLTTILVNILGSLFVLKTLWPATFAALMASVVPAGLFGVGITALIAGSLKVGVEWAEEELARWSQAELERLAAQPTLFGLPLEVGMAQRELARRGPALGAAYATRYEAQKGLLAPYAGYETLYYAQKGLAPPIPPTVTPSYAGELRAGAPPIPKYAGMTFEEIEEKYGSLLDAYQDYLDEVESRQEQFDLQSKYNAEEHARDLEDLAEERWLGLIQITADYNRRVEDMQRDHNRSLQLAERDHTYNMLQIAEWAAEARIDLAESQAKQLADAEKSYQRSVADAYESYAYERAIAEEDALYNRQQIIEEYYEQEAELADQSSAEAIRRQEDLNERLKELEEDYQKDLRRGREDHIESMWELSMRMDAYGMIREIRAYRTWVQRRTEDYTEAVQEQKDDYQRAIDEERERRRESLEEQLEDFDKAQERRRYVAERAFQRELELMERAYGRQLEAMAESHREAQEALEESIQDRYDSEKKGYARQLELMKEEFEYRLTELKREHDVEIKEYQAQTYWLTVELNKRFDEQEEIRKKRFDDEMEQLRQHTKDALTEQYNAFKLSKADLEAIFMERARDLAYFLDIELDWVEDYYKQRMQKIWNDILAGAAEVAKTSAGIAGAPYATVPTVTTTGTSAGIAGAPYTTAPVAPTTGGGAAVQPIGTTPSGQIVMPYGWVGTTTGGAAAQPTVPAEGWVGGIAPEKYQPLAFGAIDNSSPEAFVRSLAPYAAAIEQQYKIPAVAMIAIAANDTGWGKTSLATGAYNYFGVKGTGPAGSVAKQTWEVINGQRVDVVANFRKYNSPEEAFADFAKLVTNPQGRYNAGGIMDLAKFMNTLKAGGYATDPAWVQKIITIAATVRKYWPVPGLALGGVVRSRGLYELGEHGPEIVLPSDITKQIIGLSLRGMAAPGRGGAIIIEQSNWHFAGSIGAADREWFRRAAKDSAYEAIAEVLD